MAPKKIKAKKSSITKEADDDAAILRRRQHWPWSELPPTNSSVHPHYLQTYTYQLLNDLRVGSISAITKSWPPPSTRCDARQRPQLHHVATAASKNPNNLHNHFLGDGSSIADVVYELPDASYWCYLRLDTKPEFIPPPTNVQGPHLCLRGVSGANAPGCGLMVKYSISRKIGPSSFRCIETSIRYECTTADPFDAKNKCMEFTSLVHFQGKYYATSLQGALAVMQVIDTRLKITAVSAIRAVPSTNSRFFKEYFFEMKGEIFLVFLIHQKSLAVVDHVEVFRLDLDKLGWIKVDRLRGKTLFLNKGCIWVDSENFGCRDDCVYFTQGLEKSWRVFDMKSCCILPVFENEWGQTMINK